MKKRYSIFLILSIFFIGIFMSNPANLVGAGLVNPSYFEDFEGLDIINDTLIEVWIDQANLIKIGELGEMTFYIRNNNSDEVSFRVYLEIKKDGMIRYNASIDNIDLGSDQEWNTSVAYTFNEVGHWDVLYQVWTYDYSEYWSADSWWEVEPKDILDPFFENDEKAYVNVTEDFFVGVYNYYESMQNFTVKVTVVHPDGHVDTICNVSVTDLDPSENWKTPLSYTFTYTGNFTLLVVVNNDGFTGSVESFFDVYVEIDTNTTTTTTTTRSTIGFELFLVPLVILPLIVSKKRRR